ncbi:MAG: ABC transporter substrate-binding protein, partial [Terriglobia bacterium]
PDIVHALGSDSKLTVIEEPGTTYKYLAFNLQDPLLRHLKVRQAIAYAIDVPTLVNDLWRGEGDPATGILPPNVWAYEPNVKRYTLDPLKAKSLLDEAGYPDPDGEGPLTRFTLTYKTSTEELSRSEAVVIQQQLRAVGIRIEVRSYEFATFYSDIVRGNFQMYSLRWIGDNLNPDIFDAVFNSKNVPPDGKNRGHYSNPRVDRLIGLARIEPDRALRKRYYSEIQSTVADDLPYLSLWNIHNVCVANRRVKNIHLYPSGDFDFLREVSLDQK